MIQGIRSCLNSSCTVIKAAVSNIANRVSHVAKYIFLGVPAILLFSLHPFAPFASTTAFIIGIVKTQETRAVLKDINDVVKADPICSAIALVVAARANRHFAALVAAVYYFGWLGSRVK